MTRKSKREIERAVQDLGDHRDGDRELVFDRLGEPLSSFLQQLVRELLAGRRSPPPGETAEFLEFVRGRYGIEEARDEKVQQALARAGPSDNMGAMAVFAVSVSHIAEEQVLVTAEGESLEALVEAGREVEAEQLAVQETYNWWASQAAAEVDA